VTRRDFAKYWLPVLIWMTLIFGASTDLGSTQHTSRIIGPILRFFSPNVSDKTIHDIQVVVRKTGHLTGYAILALLLYRARQKNLFTAHWTLNSALFAEIIATLYAITDEFHQSFVPTREASAWDVLIDATGAAIALLILRVIVSRRLK
jgi:VanZ family protein